MKLAVAAGAPLAQSSAMTRRASPPVMWVMTASGYKDAMGPHQFSLTPTLGRGLLAGLAGTVAMTAFQRLVEMPLTGRGDSYAPADFAQEVLPIRPPVGQRRRWLNEVAHLSLGGMWGAAYGVAATAGLRGQKAVNVVFAAVYTGDVVLNTALGLYEPTNWTAQNWVVDVVDKYVQALATGLIFNHLLDPAR